MITSSSVNREFLSASPQNQQEDSPSPDDIQVIPISNILDLHSFSPKDIPAVVQEYLEECLRLGIGEVRLIHGKGKGVQRAQVHRLLSRLSFISSYRDAPPELGHWGATLVRLDAMKRDV